MNTIIENNPSCHYKTMERIQNYPLVSDSITLGLSYYKWIKSTNSLLDSTLSYTENKVNELKEKSETLAQNQLNSLDELCNHQLEKLESSYPIILEPSHTVINAPLTMINPIVDKSVNFVSSTVQNSVNRFVPEMVVNNTEKILSTYVPEVMEHESKNDSSLDKYGRIKRMSEKTQKKIYKATMKEIDHQLKIGMEKFDQLYNLVQIIIQNRPEVIDKKDIVDKVEECSKQLKSVLTNNTSQWKSYATVSYINSVSRIDVLLTNLQSLLKSYLSDDCSDSNSINRDKIINQISNGIELLKYGLEYTVYLLKKSVETEESHFESTDESIDT